MAKGKRPVKGPKKDIDRIKYDFEIVDLQNNFDCMFVCAQHHS